MVESIVVAFATRAAGGTVDERRTVERTTGSLFLSCQGVLIQFGWFRTPQRM